MCGWRGLREQVLHECKSYGELDGNRSHPVRCPDGFYGWSSIVWRFGIACRFRQRGPFCALVQFSRRICLYRSRRGSSAVQALGHSCLPVRCGFHNPCLCGILRPRYWRWDIREEDHRRADNQIVLLDCSDACLDTCPVLYGTRGSLMQIQSSRPTFQAVASRLSRGRPVFFLLLTGTVPAGFFPRASSP